MTTRATGSFEGKTWEEKTYSESEGGQKLARASVTNFFHGDVEGDGTLEYLLFYGEGGSGTFLGLERLVGRVGDQSGSFVLQHSGTFEGTGVKGNLDAPAAAGHPQHLGVLLDGEGILPDKLRLHPALEVRGRGVARRADADDALVGKDLQDRAAPARVGRARRPGRVSYLGKWRTGEGDYLQIGDLHFAPFL